MPTLRKVMVIGIASPWEEITEQYQGKDQKNLTADIEYNAGRGERTGQFRTQSSHLRDAIVKKVESQKPCEINAFFFQDENKNWVVKAQAKDNEHLVPKQDPTQYKGGNKGGGGGRSVNDHSIAAQVAFKGAVDLAAAAMTTASPGDPPPSNAQIIGDTKEFYLTICRLGGLTPKGVGQSNPPAQTGGDREQPPPPDDSHAPADDGSDDLPW